MPFLEMSTPVVATESRRESAPPLVAKQVVQTACALDCPDACSLDVTVEQGRVTKIDGSNRNPLTDGFICSKVRRMGRHLYDEGRILQPAIRRGPKGEGIFEPVSWDEALERIASNLRATRDLYGAESILPFSYGGSNGMLSQGSTDARLFRRLGTSRLAHTVCAAASSRAAKGLYGKFPGIAPEDFVHSKLILVWGANPSDSGIHLVPQIQEAQRRGAKLVVIDPRRIPLAKKADLHLALRPGTDLPVALALIRWFFVQGKADLDFLSRHATGVADLRRRAEPWTLDRAAEVAGLEVADLETLAQLYAETSPAALRCGWGPERNRNGGSATAAILALPAVAGKFGVRGGGYTMSNGAAWPLDAEGLDGEPEADTRVINMNRLGRELLFADPPIRTLFVYNANPLMTVPEQVQVRQGLSRSNLFTVVFDAVMTDTALYADVLLPATTFLEHRDLRSGYGSTALQVIQPAIPPVGEARPNFEVFAELCRRTGVDRPGDVSTEDAFQSRLVKSGLNGHSESVSKELAEAGIAFPPFGAQPVQFVDHFPWTPDRKIHLVPRDLDHEATHGLYTYQDDPATKAHPLALISPATRRTISSTFGQLHRKQEPVGLHPVDAEARGLSQGDRVRVWNDLGEVECTVAIDRDLRPGVAMIAKGLWSHNTANGNTSNALVPASATDLAEGACFNDARVQIEALA